MNIRLPWIVRVLWRPDDELDLKDKDNHPDHSKIMGYYLVTWFLLMSITKTLPPFEYGVLIAALGFGWIGMRTYLNVMTKRIQDDNDLP